MAKVIINRRENFEKALKQFKIKCKRDGILKEYRDRQQYTKPSEKKRRKRNANKAR